jgi:hypothetical protein
MKTLTKPIATLAAAGGLEYNMEDQQKTLILTDITNLTPNALLSEPRSYYLLSNAADVQELHEQQPEVIFSIPPDPSNLPKDHEADHTLLTFLMNNSSMASLLKDENYTELNRNHLKKANCDWLTNPEARYTVSQMVAGCILLDGTKAIIINCVEPYGRKKSIDPHYERYSKEDLNSSIPDLSCHYKQACVKLFESDNSSKLIIGLFSCNLLVTSSCTLSKYPVICVGPSTSNFTLSINTRKSHYLFEKSLKPSHQTGRLLFKDRHECASPNLLNRIKRHFISDSLSFVPFFDNHLNVETDPSCPIDFMLLDFSPYIGILAYQNEQILTMSNSNLRIMYLRNNAPITTLDPDLNARRFKAFLRSQMLSPSQNLWFRLIHKKISSKANIAHILQLPDDRCHFCGLQETTSHSYKKKKVISLLQRIQEYSFMKNQ